ncbi:hypothetical protein DPMN_156830 [Dreissena polymorpha]|uniref:Uncharacterized protein n=1 Tax=Dreissena polymorpha TaxID=45954 RepID=A0A9D4FTV6_DREPO|nr:hypothetical protein DPMN_156830 [Dreissena polymorpha]
MILTNLVEDRNSGVFVNPIHPLNVQKDHWLVSGYVPEIRECQLSSVSGGPRAKRELLSGVLVGPRREKESLCSVGVIAEGRWGH